MSDENSVGKVMSRVLDPAGLERRHLDAALGSINARDVDAADLYFQVSRHESWSVEDGNVKEGSFSVGQGVGVRAVCGEKTGFAYSDELLLPALQQAAGAARAISRQGKSQSVQVSVAAREHDLYPALDPTTSISDQQKTALDCSDHRHRQTDSCAGQAYRAGCRIAQQRSGHGPDRSYRRFASG
jgi:TldD protein